MQESLLVALAFPSLVCVALAVAYRGPYRRLADPHQLFRDTRRPAQLRWSLFAVLGLAALVYPAMVALRLRLFSLVFDEMLRSGHWLGWLGLAVLAIALLCEFLVVSHLVHYLKLCYDGVARYRRPQIPAPPTTLPKVAVLIPACDERTETLERPFESLHRIRYAACRIILVENSRDPAAKRDALALARRYGIEALDLPNRGTKAAALNEARHVLDADTKYLCVLDADQKLEGDLVSDLVALLEDDPEVAWFQTVQSYDTGEGSPLIVLAAAQLLLSLYDSSLPGKDVRRTCPLTGTNYLMRLEALDAVGGWNEAIVNEDTATSYRMQLRGAKGRFLQHCYARGVAPPTIAALWAQQARWAHSNSKVLVEILRGFFAPERRPLRVVFEYLVFASYEVLTFFIAALALVPTAYLVGSFALVDLGLAGAPLSRLQWTVVSLYPFYLLLVFFPYINLGLRGYPLRNLLAAQGLNTCLGTAFARGVRRTVFGRTVFFDSLSRSRDARTESALWSAQQLSLPVFLLTGYGASVMAHQYPTSPFPWIVMFWCAYNGFCVGHYALVALDERNRVGPRRPS